MKKLIAMSLALVLCLGVLAGCGTTKQEDKTPDASIENTTSTETTEQKNETTWTCECGEEVTGNFCSKCGAKKPAEISGSWTCECGNEVKDGNFCSECGAKRPGTDTEGTTPTETDTETTPETEPAPETEPEPTQKETEPEKENQKPTTLSNNWKDFQIAIGEHIFSLPVSYKELKDTTGFAIKSTEEKSWLEPDHYTIVSLRDNDDNLVCHISILNNTEEDAAYADCVVHEISFDDYNFESSGVKISIANNLSIGDKTSKEELIKMFGEPTDIYEYRADEKEYEKYNSDTLTWSLNPDWTTDNNVEIEFNINTGIISEIRTSHYEK